MTLCADRAFLLTPPGGAAIAVVRLRGNGVGPFLTKHFNKTVRPDRAVHGDLSDGTNVLDDPVIVVSSGGRVADINLHGGPWVVRSVLELACREGFEVPEHASRGSPPVPRPGKMGQGSFERPPSFHPREYRERGKEEPSPLCFPMEAGESFQAPLSPEVVDADGAIEREVLMYLPLARTELGVRALLAQPQAWALYDPSPDEIERTLMDRGLWRLLHPPRVAIVGPANVGKSTLANQLFAQERSITADLPGTTRDWVGEVADIDGLPVMLVDTPGIRHTADPIELAAIDRATGKIASADLVILVLDASHADPEVQASIVARFPGSICVLNKCDRAAAQTLCGGKPAGAIQTVATSGQGIDTLRSAIQSHFGCHSLDISQPRWWTQRQFDWLVERR